MRRNLICLITIMAIICQMYGCEKSVLVDSKCNTGKEFNCTLEEFADNFEGQLEKKFGKGNTSYWVRSLEQFSLSGTTQNNDVTLNIYQAQQYYNLDTTNPVAFMKLYENSETKNLFQFVYQVNAYDLQSSESTTVDGFKYYLPASAIAAMGYNINDVITMLKDAEELLVERENGVGEVYEEGLVVQCGYTSMDENSLTYMYIIFPCSEEVYNESK